MPEPTRRSSHFSTPQSLCWILQSHRKTWRRGCDANATLALLLLHGTADQSAPHASTLDLAASLQGLGVDVRTKLYEGWTHTDPILERPFAGDQRLHRDLLEAVELWCDGPVTAFDDAAPGLGRLCPQVLIDLGRGCMPF